MCSVDFCRDTELPVQCLSCRKAENKVKYQGKKTNEDTQFQFTKIFLAIMFICIYVNKFFFM